MLVPILRQLPGVGGRPPANLHPTGGLLGLPADFLIDTDGRVIACRHGNHAYDQWSVDDLLAARARAGGKRADAADRQ